MKKTIKTYASDGYDFGREVPSCSYCDATAEDTEISETDYNSEFICGDIECWNNYCLEWVWTGNVVEVTEEEYEVCDNCEEEDCEDDECGKEEE